MSKLEAVRTGGHWHVFKGDDCIASVWQRFDAGNGAASGEGAAPWFGEAYPIDPKTGFARYTPGTRLYNGRTSARGALIALLGKEAADAVEFT